MRNGIVQAYFGAGKGKTTSAAGLSLRALYHGYKVLFVQFLKTSEWKSGEIQLLNRFPGFYGIQASYTHPLFYPKKKRPSLKLVKEDQRKLLDIAVSQMPEYDLVVLDEILNCLDMLDKQKVMEVIVKKPEHLDLVLTGRKLPKIMLNRIHLVTEFKEVRHPFRKGYQAREGIEY